LKVRKFAPNQKKGEHNAGLSTAARRKIMAFFSPRLAGFIEIEMVMTAGE